MFGQCLWKKFLRIITALLIITTMMNMPACSEENASPGTRSLNFTSHENKLEVTYPIKSTRVSFPATTVPSAMKSSNQSTCGGRDNNTNPTGNCKSSQGNKTSIVGGKLSTDEILLICGFAFTFIVGVFGNSFVCFVFGYKRRKHRSVTETLLLYLGIVDLLASLVNPLLFAYWTVTRYKQWDFGYVGCKILVPLAPITVTISATIIIIICLDRYRAIVSPFKGRYTRTQINIFVGIAVVVSVLSYTGYIIHLEVIPGKTCLVRHLTAIDYAVPYIVITIARDVGYIIIFCFTSAVIFHHLKVNEHLQVNTTYLKKRRKDSKRICRVLFCVGVVFALLVFPKDALSLASTISWMFPPGISHSSTIMYLNAWLKVLNISNSCVNVFIYSHMHARFKNELCKLFGVCFKTRSTLNGATTTMVTDGDYDESSSRNNGDKDPLKTVREDGNQNMQMGRNDNGFDVEKHNGHERALIVRFNNSNGFSEAETLIESEGI